MISLKYIRSLDGLRAIAIILVMLFHFGIIGFGWLGVQMFFVLSGFLITGILLNLKDSRERFSGKIKTFYIRRVLRIFPVYYFYLLCFLVCWIIYKYPADFGYKVLYLFTYTYNFTRTFYGWTLSPYFTHLWSLCVEEQFYLIWPFIILILPQRFLKWAMLFCVIAAPVFRFVLLKMLTADTLLDNGDIGDAVYWNTIS